MQNPRKQGICHHCFYGLCLSLIFVLLTSSQLLDVLFRLGGLPRIALLTAGYPGLGTHDSVFQFVYNKVNVVVTNDWALLALIFSPATNLFTLF